MGKRSAAPAAPRTDPSGREYGRVRRDVDLTRVIVALIIVLGVLGLTYLGVALSQSLQGLDVRHLIDVELGPREWGWIGSSVATAAGFIAVLMRSNRTEKMVGYDVPRGVADVITSALADHAANAIRERAVQHAQEMALLEAIGAEVLTIKAGVEALHVEAGDHVDALDDLVELLHEAQVQVSFANPVPVQRRAAERAEQPPAAVEPAAGQLISADRAWGPAGPPKLKTAGDRRAHRAATSQQPAVPAPVSLAKATPSGPLATLPAMPAPRVRSWSLDALTAPRPSTAVQRALARVDAGAATLDDVVTDRR